jgi:hypothetical protein
MTFGAWPVPEVQSEELSVDASRVLRILFIP